MIKSTEKEPSISDIKREAAMENQRREHVKRVQLIVFKLGSEEYALPIDQIKEVVVTPRVAKMPQTAPHIKGIANIRGNIIAILDLEQRFGISLGSEDALKSSNYTLVVESDVYKAGILVKEVPDTLTINVSDIDSSSNFIQSASADEKCIEGVVNTDERLIILIDMVKLMEIDNIHSTVQKAIK